MTTSREAYPHAGEPAVVPPPPDALPTSAVAALHVPADAVDRALELPLRAATPAGVERRYRSIRRALVVELGIFATVAFVLVLLELGFIASEYGVAGVIILLLGLAPLPLLIAFGLWLDRFEPEPPWLLARALLWGAGVSILVAGIVNSSVAAVGGEFAAAVFSAPIGEELLKGMAVWWVYQHRREHLHGITDGIVYAIFVGVGFTIVEDTTYYAMALSEGEDVFELFFARGVMTPLLHSFFTAFTAMAIARAATIDGRGRRAMLVLAGYAMAVFTHALWNSGIGIALFPVLYLPPFVIGLVLLRRHRRRQEQVLTSWVRLEVGTGLVPEHAMQRILAKTTLGGFLRALGSSSHELHALRRVQAVTWSLASHREAVATRAAAGTPPQPIDRALDDRMRMMLRDTLQAWQSPAPDAA
jgi:protease PrsW